VFHELEGAPKTCRHGGQLDRPVERGGGWSWVLCDLKTLLENGKPLAA
jgi:hypothetical protein